MHQRVSQPRCRQSPRASLQYPVHGPCVAALAAPGFHRGDSFRAAPSSCPSCRTLGVTKTMAMSRMHCAVAARPSIPVARCEPESAVPYVRTMRALHSRSVRLAFVAVTKVSGSSLGQATRPCQNQRLRPFQARSAPAPGCRREQMLVSQWALPHPQGQRILPGAVPCGSGVGGAQTVPRLSTAGDAQPFVQADGFAAA